VVVVILAVAVAVQVAAVLLPITVASCSYTEVYASYYYVAYQPISVIVVNTISGVARGTWWLSSVVAENFFKL